MTVSIIIAVKELNDNLKFCLKLCLDLDYPDFEIIVFPDIFFEYSDPRVRIIPSGSIAPPKKRDLALKEAKGDILAFIDDDAYPEKDWLKNASPYFQDKNVGAVCGPAVTAPGESLLQRASGKVYESVIISGDQRFRFKPLHKRNIDDYPTCNLLVRTSVMRQLNGFNTDFWPGEDTFLCSGITEKLGKLIVYDPKVLVFHLRRPLFLPHLRQIANYGLHRGYFVKKGYRSSLRISYFLPTLLLLGISLGAVFALFFSFFRLAYFTVTSIYLFVVAIFSLSKEFKMIPLKFSGIILTHLTYGLYFLLGIFSKKMKEEQ